MKPIIRNQRVRRLTSSVLFCVILLCVLSVAGAILKPTRSLLTKDAGAAWYGYHKQPKDSLDVVFFGNSHVFNGVDPSTIWKSEGIASYVLAGPTQPLSIGRHYVAEALRTQSPKVVAVELSNLNYDERSYTREFHLTNVGYMPHGINRLKAAFLDTPKADRTATLVDLWAYHSRWSTLRPSDFNLVKRSPADDYLKGFRVIARSRAVPSTRSANPTEPPASIIAAENRSIEYLREIARLAEANDIEVLLFLNPTGPPGVYERSFEHAKAELSGEFDNVKFLDLSAPDAVPDLSYETDFYDSGHLVTLGAEKSSRVLAAYLAATYGLRDRRDDPAYGQWARDVELRDQLVEERVYGKQP